MPRRFVLVAAACCVLALVCAVAPWTLSSDALRSAVSAQLKDLYGLELSVEGRSTIAFLPVPRLKFEDITVRTSDGTPIVRGGGLRGEFRVVPLLAGRLQFSELSLSQATIDIEVDGDSPSPLDTAVTKFRDRAETQDGQRHVSRLVVNGASLRLHDRARQSETVLDDVYLAANWPRPGSALDLSGTATWRGEVITLTGASFLPSALASGRPSRLSAEIKAPLGHLAVSGDLTWQDGEPRFSGRSLMETPSLQEFSRWSGLDLPLGNLIQGVALDGETTLEGRTVSWPNARLTLGADRLDGALSARIGGERPVVTGTLAAERLDLTAFVAPLARMRSGSGWNPDAIDPGLETGADLDLRLSAATVRIGLARMDDLAANVSIKPGRYEVSVAGASLNRGMLKGRAVLAGAADGIDFKGQGSFERVDVGSLLSDLGASRWITGPAQGQLAVESSGDSAADLVHRLRGRASIAVRQGELVGVALNEALRRAERRPLTAPLEWRGGRTPFEQAYINATILDGAAEITEAGMTAPSLHAAAQGRVSLAERAVAAKAKVESTPGSGTTSGILFDISGPWDDVAIVPDAQSLMKRSGEPLPGRQDETLEGSTGQ